MSEADQDKKLKIVYDSKQAESEGVNPKAVGFDKYDYTILDVKLFAASEDDYFVTKRIRDNKGINYLTVYDFDEDVMTFYIECDKVLISGDKRFIWMLKENKIYDIENGLSTFFIWPDD